MNKTNTKKLWTSVATDDHKSKVLHLVGEEIQERTPVRCLIIYHSRPETQNTKKIAESMALAVKAELTSIDKVHEVNINDYDIVGFGSGVYFGRFGKTLIRYAKNLANQKQRAFIFYTCGAKSCDKTKNKFSQLLESKGRTVIGSWFCEGRDVAFTLFKKTGGFNKGKPNEADCKAAGEWIIELLGRQSDQ